MKIFKVQTKLCIYNIEADGFRCNDVLLEFITNRNVTAVFKDWDFVIEMGEKVL